MNGIFKMKSKVHSFVNMFFYFLAFATGFIVGKLGSIENIKEQIRLFINSRYGL